MIVLGKQALAGKAPWELLLDVALGVHLRRLSIPPGPGLSKSSQLPCHPGPCPQPCVLSFSCKQTPAWKGGAYITHICLLQTLLSFMLLGQIPGKGPLGEAPFLSTPCPALSVRRQNNFFHKVCPSQRKHTRALWHGLSEGKGLCSELLSKGSWPEIRCLKTWKAVRQESIKDGLYHLVRMENQFSTYGTVAWGSPRLPSPPPAFPFSVVHMRRAAFIFGDQL